MQKITKCPYCGSDRGMFAKFKANGTDTYSFDGKMESSEVMDYFSYNKTMRCMDCSKRIMSYEEFIRDYYVEDQKHNEVKEYQWTQNKKQQKESKQHQK